MLFIIGIFVGWFITYQNRKDIKDILLTIDDIYRHIEGEIRQVNFDVSELFDDTKKSIDKVSDKSKANITESKIDYMTGIQSLRNDITSLIDSQINKLENRIDSRLKSENEVE